MSKLNREAELSIDHDDLAAILTEELCTYNALAALRVEYISVEDEGRTYRLTLTPKPAKEPQE